LLKLFVLAVSIKDSSHSVFIFITYNLLLYP
jgi:hypothetical protein